MGVSSSKIDAKRRARIYKRVKLTDAREQFAKLTSAEHGQDLHLALIKCPVSRNFNVNFANQDCKEIVLEKCDVEVDADESWKMKLFHLLSCAIVQSNIPSLLGNSRNANLTDCFLGLHKDQYDALHFPTSPSAQSTTTVS